MAPGRIPLAWGEPVNLVPNARFLAGTALWGINNSAGVTDLGSGVARMPDSSSEFGWRCYGSMASGGSVGIGPVTSNAPRFSVPRGAAGIYSAAVDFYCADPPDAGGGFRVNLNWYDAAGTDLGTTVGPTVAIAAGHRARVLLEGVTPPSGAATCRLSPRMALATIGETGDSYVTNVTLTEGASASAFFDGHFPDRRFQGVLDLSPSETLVASRDPFDEYPRAATMLDSIPPAYRGDPDVRAAIYVQARESLRVEAELDALLDDLFITRASDRGLRWSESLLRLTVAPTDLTLEERRTRALTAIRRGSTGASGSEWVAAVTRALGPGWTYYEYVSGGQPAPAGQKINEVLNPTFEVDASFYTTFGSGGVNPALAAQTAAAGEAETGTKVGRVSGTSSAGVSNEFIYETTGHAVSVGDRIYLRARVSVVLPVGATVRLGYLRQDGSAFQTGVTARGEGITKTGVGIYVLEGVLVVPSGTSAVQLGVWLDSIAATTAYDFRVDGLMYTRLNATENPPGYFDGTRTGAAWTGTAHASSSASPPTPANPPASTIRIEVPFEPSSGNYAAALTFIRAITPAHLDIQLFYQGGFVLDSSQLDLEGIL